MCVTHRFPAFQPFFLHDFNLIFSSFWSELDSSRRLQRSRRSDRQRSSRRLFVHDFRVRPNRNRQNVHDGRRKKLGQRVFVGKRPAFWDYSENNESHFWWAQFRRLFGVRRSCQVKIIEAIFWEKKREAMFLVKDTRFSVFVEKLRFALWSFATFYEARNFKIWCLWRSENSRS